MKRKNLVVIVVLVLIVLQLNLVLSHSEHETLDVKSIINSKVHCDKLNETQLEAIGDYFMQLMHQNNHEQMEEMMCDNDENCLKEMHTNMAYRFYCNQIDNADYYKPKLFWVYTVTTLSILILLILTAIIIYFILKNKNKVKNKNKGKVKKKK